MNVRKMKYKKIVLIILLVVIFVVTLIIYKNYSSNDNNNVFEKDSVPVKIDAGNNNGRESEKKESSKQILFELSDNSIINLNYGIKILDYSSNIYGLDVDKYYVYYVESNWNSHDYSINRIKKNSYNENKYIITKSTGSVNKIYVFNNKIYYEEYQNEWNENTSKYLKTWYIKCLDMNTRRVSILKEKKESGFYLDKINSLIYYRDENNKLYKMNIDGSNLEKVANNVVDMYVTGGLLTYRIQENNSYLYYVLYNNEFKQLDGINPWKYDDGYIYINNDNEIIYFDGTNENILYKIEKNDNTDLNDDILYVNNSNNTILFVNSDGNGMGDNYRIFDIKTNEIKEVSDKPIHSTYLALYN